MLFIIIGLIIIGVTFYFHVNEDQVEVAKRTTKQFAKDAAPALLTVRTAAERAKGDFHNHRTEARLEKLTRELEELKTASKNQPKAQIVPRSNRKV